MLIQPPNATKRHKVYVYDLLRLPPGAYQEALDRHFTPSVTPGDVRNYILKKKSLISSTKPAPSNEGFGLGCRESIVKQYPSIPGRQSAPIGEECIAFEKYDGSNLRFEYNRKKGWYKFGTRTRLFDKNDRVFGDAIDIFQQTLAKGLEEAFNKHYPLQKSFMVFAEYFGPNSFAGKHRLSDPKELVIIDINIGRSGFVSPRDFLKQFGHLKVAEVVYEGRLTKDFIEDVSSGKYDVEEGVVCKGGQGHRLWRCKIKTKAYLDRLKRAFKDGWANFWE